MITPPQWIRHCPAMKIRVRLFTGEINHGNKIRCHIVITCHLANCSRMNMFAYYVMN